MKCNCTEGIRFVILPVNMSAIKMDGVAVARQLLDAQAKYEEEVREDNKVRADLETQLRVVIPLKIIAINSFFNDKEDSEFLKVGITKII